MSNFNTEISTLLIRNCFEIKIPDLEEILGSRSFLFEDFFLEVEFGRRACHRRVEGAWLQYTCKSRLNM